MNGLNKYVIRVDMRSNEHVKFGDVELYRPAVEGDSYGAKPFHGILEGSISGGLPVGTKVFVQYHAIDDHILIDGLDYYITSPDNVVAYEEDGEIKAHRTLLIEHVEKEKISSPLIDVIQYDKSPETKARVISSDIDGISAGDIIEYKPGLDWEYSIKQVPHFFISRQYSKFIFRINALLTSSWLSVKKVEQMKFGVDVMDKWYEIVDDNGDGIGTYVYSNQKPQNKYYIPSSSIEAQTDDIESILKK